MCCRNQCGCGCGCGCRNRGCDCDCDRRNRGCDCDCDRRNRGCDCDRDRRDRGCDCDRDRRDDCLMGIGGVQSPRCGWFRICQAPTTFAASLAETAFTLDQEEFGCGCG